MMCPRFRGTHPFERGKRAVDVAEIAHLRHALELGGRHILDEREDAGHGVIDPHVDRPQFLLDSFGGSLDAVGVRDVALNDDRLASQRFDVALGSFQSFKAPGDEADVAPSVSANMRAVARPTPAAAPVMTMTRGFLELFIGFGRYPARRTGAGLVEFQDGAQRTRRAKKAAGYCRERYCAARRPPRRRCPVPLRWLRISRG